MCCLGLYVAHTKFHGMWVVGLWIVQHDTMVRHAWVFVRHLAGTFFLEPILCGPSL